MQQWQQVLVDILVLAFFALLYYLYQKNRIIYYSEKEFYIELESLLENLKHFLDNNQDIHEIDKYHDFMNALAQFHHKLPTKDDLSMEVPQNLPQEFVDHFEHLKELLQK